MELEISTLANAKNIRIEFEDGTTLEGRLGTNEYDTYYLIQDNGYKHFNVIPLIDGSGEPLAESTYGEITDLTVLD